MAKVKVGCIQMNAGPNIDNNLAQAETLIREAVAQGAEFIFTPENTDYMRGSSPQTLETAPTESDHPAIPFFSTLAKELNIHLLIGSIKIKLEQIKAEKIANRSLFFNPDGVEVARYDKIHLYDVDLQNGEQYRESDTMQGGSTAVLVDTPFGKTGITICYDVRFAHLYRELAHKGAKIFSIPAAFTEHTGKAHWETLLRARAIETGCFVIAAAQVGMHEGGRATHGHSMIINPWGEILAEKTKDEIGVIMHEINLEEVTTARNAVPSLSNDREYTIKEF